MKNLAKATILALIYFELCEDEELGPDVALTTSESILAELENSSDEERDCLFTVAKEMLVQEKANMYRKDVIRFLEEFDESYFPNY